MNAVLHANISAFSTSNEPVPGAAPAFLRRLARCLGRTMRRRDHSAPPTGRDATTGLLNRDGLLDAGNARLAEAGSRPAVLVVFDCHDLQELRCVYGRETAHKVRARLVCKLKAIAGDRGLVARTAPTEFTVLLPGTTRQKAGQAIARVLGNPGRIEYDVADSEIVMAPNFIVEALEPAMGLAQTLDQTSGALTEIRHNQELRVRYLTLERERHSRPTPLMSSRH